MIAYPMTTERNFDEILRVINSLQLTARHRVATPANWRNGEDVIIAGSVSNRRREGKLPERLGLAEALHPHCCTNRPPDRRHAIPAHHKTRTETSHVKTRILILGAGFGGLELTPPRYQKPFGRQHRGRFVIDKSEGFIFGFAKLDLMFGRMTRAAGPQSPTPAMPSRACGCCGRRSRPSTPKQSALPPTRACTRRTSSWWLSGPTTTSPATPGLGNANEFYSVAGAESP